MTTSPPTAATPSILRAWLFLIWLSWQRQARVRLLVWVSLGLLLFTTAIVWLNTSANRWGMWHWRSPPRTGPMYFEFLEMLEVTHALAADPVSRAVVSALDTALVNTGFFVFSKWLIFATYVTFLLPLWSLSFATDAVGREREAGQLIWVLTRPIPRWAIYLAKFLACLPWILGLNLGGFALLCWAAGPPGALALRTYWPAALWGGLAFAALFFLFGVLFRRAAVIALLYAFFLETVMGNLPGYLKRASISFYTNCMMYAEGHALGVRVERPDTYLPVSGDVAWLILALATVVLLGIGMVVFTHSEYLDTD